MKYFYLFVFFLLAGNAFGQVPISINQADMPATPDTLRVSIGAVLPAFNPTQTGPNYTWNFANLVPTAQRVEKFVAVSSTPAMYQLLFTIPLSPNRATIAYEEPAGAVLGAVGGIGTMPAITDYYSFYRNGTTDFRKVGFGVTMSGLPAPVTYDNHEIIYKFPLNYNNRDSANYRYKLNVPGVLYYGETGKRVNKADGWGTLITPFGTFQTLRVVSKIIARDTLSMDTLISTAYDKPVTREYKWLAKNHRIPLLVITTTELTPGLETVTSVVYRDSYRKLAGILASGKPLAGKETLVYPNPFSGQVTVSFNKADAGPATVYLQDALGRTICRQTVSGQPNELVKTIINTSELGLSGGYYFIRIENGSASRVQKLVRLAH